MNLYIKISFILFVTLIFCEKIFSQELHKSFNNRANVIKGSLPSDPNYWNYNNWYKNNSVVSLIVSGEDKEHLIDALKKIKILKEKNVLIGEIIVVGGFLFGDLSNDVSKKIDLKNKIQGNMNRLTPDAINFLNQIAAPSELPELAQKLGLGDSSFTDVAPIIEHYEINLSPSWIIRYKGKDYIYEGNFDISRFFTGSGQYSAINYE